MVLHFVYKKCPPVVHRLSRVCPHFAHESPGFVSAVSMILHRICSQFVEALSMLFEYVREAWMICG